MHKAFAGRKSVLVTGGCGFIAANLLRRLQDLGGYRVRAFDNESLGRREHIAGLGAEFVKGDIRDAKALDAALEGVDTVVHLAAHTRVLESIDEPQHNFEINAGGTLQVLEAMRRAGVRRLINASTGGAILGEAEPPIHEGMLPRPISPYGASKLAAEAYCSAYCGSFGIRTLSLRFANVYGERSSHKGSAVAAFIKRVLAGQPVTIFGDGSQVRDFVFAADLCDGIVAGINSDVTGVIQLGSGVPVSINQLLDELARVAAPTPVRRTCVAFREGEVRSTYCDISRARAELGFEPRTSLAEGLARTWRWFAAHDAPAVERPEPLRSRNPPLAGADADFSRLAIG